VPLEVKQCYNSSAEKRVIVIYSKKLLKFLTKNKTTTRSSPYSPDVAPCGFLLFLKIKIHFKGKRSEDLADIHMNTAQQLKAVNSDDFRCCLDPGNREWSAAEAQPESALKGINTEIVVFKITNYLKNISPSF
jgi:hypothetical protein